MAEIVPADFLTSFSHDRLLASIRYLKALGVRVARYSVSPLKDKAKADQVAIHEERLASCKNDPGFSRELLDGLDEYWRMIEEFKVSLFAQELKTAFPISAKRLEKKWEELAGYCSLNKKP